MKDKTEKWEQIGKRYPDYVKDSSTQTVKNEKTGKIIRALKGRYGDEDYFLENYLGDQEGVSAKTIFGASQ